MYFCYNIIILNNCIYFQFFFCIIVEFIGRNCFRTYTSQTGGCEDCFPDPNFVVDDLTRNGLTVAVYGDLLFGFRLIDSRRTVYETTINTKTNKIANTFTTTGSLLKYNFCLTNSDIVGLPAALKHDNDDIYLCMFNYIFMAYTRRNIARYIHICRKYLTININIYIIYRYSFVFYISREARAIYKIQLNFYYLI